MGLTAQERLICSAIDQIQEELEQVSDKIHEFNEIGYQEFLSSALLTSHLSQHGLPVEKGLAGLATAFHAHLGPDSGPQIALLAEYDALPGLGHACGHNIIGTAAIGAAIGLTAVKDALPGGLHVFGTPAEEGFVPNAGGKVVMYDAGLFRGMDAVMMVHPGDPFSGSAGSLARDHFSLTFHGRRPSPEQPRWDAVDSQDPVMLTQVAINVLRQRIDPRVVIQWIVEKGGDNPNIVPVESIARLYVRAPSMEMVEQVVARVLECARGASIATGATFEYKRRAQRYDEVIPNQTLNRAYVQAVRDLGVPEDEISDTPVGPVTSSNDMGIISKHAPVVSGRIIVGPRGLKMHTKEAVASTNSPQGHRGLMIGAKCLALVAWRLMTVPGMLDEAKAGLKEALQRKP